VLSGNNSSIFVDTIEDVAETVASSGSLSYFGQIAIVADELSCDAASAE
jgi:hypothetical protein